jgi:uncharacterized protein (TIGR03067 family)
MRALGVMVLAAGLLVGADGARENAAKEEAKKLEGTWVVVSCEAEGEKVPEIILRKEVVRFIIRGDTIALKVDGEPKGEDRFRLDPKACPKTIDLNGKEGQRALGIYSLEGDHLRICWTERGKTRPAAFATQAGSGFDLFVLVREKPTKPDPDKK